MLERRFVAVSFFSVAVSCIYFIHLPYFYLLLLLFLTFFYTNFSQSIIIKQVQVAQNETNLQKATSLQRNMGSEFSCMIKEAKVLGMALGISCLNG